MGKVLIRHCEAAEVLEAFRHEREGIRRAHLQVIWLLLSGEEKAEVARVSGFGGRWIDLLINRWNSGGMDSLGDRRHGNAGAEAMLDEAGLAALAAALEKEPEDGGIWSGRKVAEWMSSYLGRDVSPKRGLDYLHRLDFSLQRPRPRHANAAGPEEQADFKKNSRKRWLRRNAKSRANPSKSGRSTSTGLA